MNAKFIFTYESTGGTVIVTLDKKLFKESDKMTYLQGIGEIIGVLSPGEGLAVIKGATPEEVESFWKDGETESI